MTTTLNEKIWIICSTFDDGLHVDLRGIHIVQRNEKLSWCDGAHVTLLIRCNTNQVNFFACVVESNTFFFV